MKFLRNKETGQVLHWNPQMAKLKQMVPCEPPVVSGKPPAAAEEKELPPVVEIAIPPDPPPEPEENPYLPKKVAAKLVHKWFNRSVDRVKIKEFYKFAKEQTGKDFPEKLTKLQLVTMLNEELTASCVERNQWGRTGGIGHGCLYRR